MVLVSIDTLRADRLSQYGYEAGSTPTFDRLAREGVLFERAYSPAPLTLPAHASMLTGTLPTEHGVRDNLGYRLDTATAPTLAQRLRDEGYRTGAVVSSYVLRSETGIDAGFEYFEDNFEYFDSAGLGDVQRAGEESVDLAIEWLSEIAGEPFFLFLHLYEPHAPYEPPEPFRSQHASPYDGEIAYADALLGRVVEKLEELAYLDEVVLVATSDHGEGLRDHDELEHGVLVYREALQVPLVIRLPHAARAGERLPWPVQLSDLHPTLLALLDLPPTEGVSGLSLLDGGAEGELETRVVYSESYRPYLRFGWAPLLSAIQGPYHLIEGARTELYDVIEDSAERENRAEVEREAATRLRRELRALERPAAEPFEESSETQEALASLGYIGSTRGEPTGPLLDPREHLRSVEVLDDGAQALRDGRVDQAIAILEPLSREQPGFVDAWKFLGLAKMEQGRPEEALADLEKAFDLSGGSRPLARPMAGLALQLGRLEEAIAYLAVAIEEEPEMMVLRLDRTRSLLHLRRPDEALAEAQRALEVEPGNAEAHYLAGVAHLSRQEFAAAEAEFERVLEREPFHPGARNDLALLLAGRGDTGRARLLLEELLARFPNNPVARQTLERLAGAT